MVLCKKCKQVKLTRCQRNLPGAAHDPARLHVEREMTDVLSQQISGIDPPHQSTNAREELGKRKRFYQVIICAGIQSEHAILNRGREQ